MSKKSIFLCHSSNDKKFVEKLAQDLLDNGIDVWYDKWEIKVGDSIVEKINSGISDFHYMGVIFSSSSTSSNWVNKELNAGLIKELNHNKVVILPILHKKCKIPPLISDKKYADFTTDYEHGLAELLEVFNIKKEKKEVNKIPDGRLYVDNKYYDNFYYDNVIH